MVLEVKDKIIKIRKELKLSQKQLAGDVYSQSYVAAIEKGKRTIKEEAIYYFAVKFTEEYKKQGKNKEITYEWLSKSFGEQLREFYEETCEKILNCEDKEELYKYYDEIKEVEEYLKLSERVKIYHYLGYMFIKVEDYEKSQEIYVKALYEAILLKDYGYLGKIMANIYYNLKVLKRVEGIKEYQSLLEKYENYLEEKVLEAIYSHLLFLYEFMNDNQNSIICIEKLEKFCKSERRVSFSLSKFTHYVELEKIEEAKKLYPQFLVHLEKVDKNLYHFYKLESLSYFEKIASREEIMKIIGEAIEADREKLLEMETTYGLAKSMIKYEKVGEGKKLLANLLTSREKLLTSEYRIQVEGIKLLLPYLEREDIHFVIELWNKNKKLLSEYRDYSYIPLFIEYYNRFYFDSELKRMNEDLKEMFNINK